VCDGLLSIAVVLLFALPFSNHLKAMQGDDNLGQNSSHRAGHRTTLIRNLALSSVSIFFGLMSLLVFASFLATHSVQDPAAHIVFVSIVILPTTETWMSLVIVHTLTLIWLPFAVKRGGSKKKTSSKQGSKFSRNSKALEVGNYIPSENHD
jgi:hypothetical protein